MFLSGLESVGADDGFTRIVAVAEAPGHRAGRIVTHGVAAGVGATGGLDGHAGVAAPVAWVHPQILILIEIFRGVDINRQGFHTLRNCAVACGNGVQETKHLDGADELIFLRVFNRRSATHAGEADVGHGLGHNRVSGKQGSCKCRELQGEDSVSHGGALLDSWRTATRQGRWRRVV